MTSQLRNSCTAFCAALLVFSCSDDDDPGHDHSGTGGRATGGASSGGSSTGGSSTGGVESSGGVSSGGASTGGTESSGGSDAGVSGGAGGADASADGGASPIDGGTEAGAEPDAAVPSVTIRFKAKVGTADFRCGQSYPNVGSTQVTVQPLDFRFYVEKVWLVTAAGDEVPMTFATRSPWQTSDVTLLDFEERRGICFSGDAATNAVITGDAPPGNYTGIVFTVGVPASLNHVDPATYPPPLKAPGMPWSWLMGFRFLKAELQGPTATFGVGYAHPGSTSCSGSPQAGTVNCARSNRNRIKLANFDPATNFVVVDLAEIFEGSDLSVDTECHGTGSSCAPMYAALGIDLATGQSVTTQTAFRVE